MKDFTPELTITSPGRINLIGEHTDYNMGYVLPTAIDKKITLQFRKNGTAHDCHINSLNYSTSFTVDLRQIAPSKIEWENYVLGVLHEISKRTNQLRGFDCQISSNLPAGSGLSSSAALECGLALGLNKLFGLGLSKQEIISLSVEAEHNYVGTQCGIMDQFASVMSREGFVILLDCQSLEHSYIPIDLSPYKLLLLNSNVSHNLATSEYNTRRKECEEGIVILKRRTPSLSSLREVSLDLLSASKKEMNDIIYRRCKFIIEENARVLEVVKALQQNNLSRLGELLYEGHEGLSKLYEISCPETDFLVDFSKDIEGVLGARQMGGGFGGCTINLVHQDAVQDYVAAVTEAYKGAFGIALSSFEGSPSNGTSIL